MNNITRIKIVVLKKNVEEFLQILRHLQKSELA